MTKETISKAVQRLENLNPNNEFAYEEAIMAFLSIGKIPVIADDIPAYTKICRSRTHSTGETFFQKVSDIFIAPNHAIKGYARCNKPFQSKFYGSENRITSYEELVDNWLDNFKEGDKCYVTLGQWITQKDFKLVIVTTPDKHLRVSQLDKYYGGFLDTAINGYDKETKNSFIEFYRYLFEKFRKDAKKDIKIYIITSAYTNLALQLSSGVTDGLIYISVPAKEQGLNFAFNFTITNHINFKLNRVYRNEMTVSKSLCGKKFKETGIIEAASFDVGEDKIIW